MGVTAIGASVKRTEDIRFITGKGHYVDDINRPGQAYAYFLRSPHAHATIDKIDASAALKSPGVVAVFTGDDIAADKIGGLICGWMIHSKDGSPMKVGAPSLRSRRARCAMSAIPSPSSSPTRYAQAQGRGGENRRRLRRAAGGGRYRERGQAWPAANPRGRAEQHGVQLASRRQGRDRRGVRGGGARDQTRSRQQSPDPERHGAARGARRLRFGHGRHDALYDEPESACRAGGPVRLHRSRAREQAAGHRARRRRRVRLEDFHLRRGDRLRLGGEEDQPAGEMDRGSHRGLSLGRARSRPRHARANWRSTPAAR